MLQLGRSSIYFTERELENWAARDRFALTPRRGEEPAARLSHDPRLAALGCMDDRAFFERLGFDAVESSDIEEWEGADHIFDLNDELPEQLVERFDAVFETGTIVQIFDLPRVLSNLARLVKPGGRIIHCAVPSNNHMDLGFYMLCPSFFADFYSANGWRIECHWLCEYYAWWHGGKLHSDRWRVYEYTPGALDALSYGRYGGAQAATFMVATRVDGSTGDIRPQLGHYQRAWQDFEDQGGADDAVAGLTRAGAADNMSPAMLRFTAPWKRVAETVRRRLLPRRMPRLIARV